MGKRKVPRAAAEDGGASAMTLVASAVMGVLAAVAVALLMLSLATPRPPEGEEVPREEAEPPLHDGVRTVTMGVDVHSIDELLEIAEPCLVANFEPALHAELARQWSPDSLRRSGLSQADLTVRLTRGANRTRIMRYSLRNSQTGARGAPLFDATHGFAWPRHTYDDWDMTSGKTLEGALLSPPAQASASFSTGVDELEGVHPAGVAAARRIEQALCAMWLPNGCAPELEIRRLVWMSSAGLGQQLHYDAFVNLFFHLDGHKEVLLVPPQAMVDEAHLFPTSHPAARQSQVAWDASEPTRAPLGYSTLVGEDIHRPAPSYDASGELRVSLRPGDLLLIPPYWGHQTFTSLAGPSTSFALWLFPHRDPSGASPTPKELRGKQYDYSKDAAANLALSGVGSTNVIQAWAALRELGRLLAIEVLGEESGRAVLRQWVSQRWRPQFGGLGVQADAPLPARVLCESTPGLESSRDGARQLAKHVRALSSWSPSVYRTSVERGEVQDILDWLVGLMPQLRGIEDELRQDVNAPLTRAEMVVLLVRSLSECATQE